MTMDFAYLFFPVITLLTAQATVLNLAQFRFRPKKLFIILSVEFLLQTAASILLLFYFGLEYYVRWYILIIDIPALLVFYYISKRRDLRDLFTVFVTIFIIFTCSIPALWMQNLLDGDNWWICDLFRVIIYIILFILIHLFVRKRYIQLQEEIENGWGIFCILPMIGSAILYYEYIICSKNGNITEIIFICTFTVLIMASVFIVFNYVFNQLHEKYIVQEQKRILSMQNKAQKDQFEQQKESSEKTNRRWHDLRHGLQELIELLEAGEIQTAVTYLKEQRGIDSVPKEEFCMHPTVNSILCLWAERSRRADIAVEIHADVPEALKIEPMELSALFANAFENAYEGCLRLPKEVPKFIKVETRYSENRLAVGFTNSCIDDIVFQENMPVSSKKDGGIGTRSIAYTVQRFHGAKFFDAREGIFTARFILNV